MTRASRRSALKGAVGVAAGVLASACATTSEAGVVGAGAVAPRVHAEREAKDGVVHIGNSTHLIVLDGIHMLTEPWLRDPADAVLTHRVPPAPLPTNVDVVLVTHEHEDHFDTTALARVDKSATVVIADWLVDRARAIGFKDVRGMKPGDRADDVRGVSIEAVEARHDVDEVVYRIERRVGETTRSVFFGGDTLPTTQIRAMAKRAPVDYAILPADGGALLGKRYVMNVDEAQTMARELCATHALLTHHECSVSFPWGVIVDVRPPTPSDFPDWFHIPTPGERVPFPWSTA